LNSFLDNILSSIKAVRSREAIIYFCNERSSKKIEDADIPIIYDCLQQINPNSHLDLILHTSGGYMNAARRIALLLREYAASIHILVPYKAKSAGTLLCLVADQLLLGKLSEISPIDVQLEALNPNSSTFPLPVSSEDIRLFRLMAENWFGVSTETDGTQLLFAICQRIFPANLTAIFRAYRQAQIIADELLDSQIEPPNITEKNKIIEQLISGSFTHDYTFTPDEAKKIGLNVELTSPKTEKALWIALQALYDYCLKAPLNVVDSPHYSVSGLIIGPNYQRQFVTKTHISSPVSPQSDPKLGRASVATSGWEEIISDY
jgi:hypothetical protein